MVLFSSVHSVYILLVLCGRITFMKVCPSWEVARGLKAVSPCFV